MKSPRQLKGDELKAAIGYVEALMREPFYTAKLNVKGRGHNERTVLTRSNKLLAALPFEKIAYNKEGSTNNYTSDAVLSQFHTDLRTAGIVIDHFAYGENWLVMPRRFASAVVYHNLTGKFPEGTATQRKAVTAKWKKFKAQADAPVGVPPLGGHNPSPDRLKPELQLPDDDREALRVFFAAEQHPAPERILALKHASGLTWSQFKAASLP